MFLKSLKSKIFIGSITDIDETVNFKTKLEISEQKYRFIANNTSDFIMQHNNDGIITYVSNAAEKITGYSVAELTNRDPYDFFHPDDAASAVREAHENNLNGIESPSVQYRFRKKNGDYVEMDEVIAELESDKATFASFN